jgi:hypothetical protein
VKHETIVPSHTQIFLAGLVYILRGSGKFICSLACGDGVTIVHSHPFNKAVEHTHSSAEFQLITHLSQIWVTGAIVLSLLVAPLLLFFLELLPDTRLQGFVSFRPTGIQLRAPPSYSLCAVFICRHRLFLRRYRN